MDSLREEIQTRGHCLVSFHPVAGGSFTFAGQDLKLATLAMQARSHGESFPRLDLQRDVAYGDGYIEQDFDFDQYRESWRLHETGHFMTIIAYPFDWSERAQTFPVPCGHSKVTMSYSFVTLLAHKVCVFLQNVAVKSPETFSWCLNIRLCRTKGRSLLLDAYGMMQINNYTTAESQTAFSKELPASAILSQPLHVAAEATAELLRPFGVGSMLRSAEAYNTYRRAFNIQG